MSKTKISLCLLLSSVLGCRPIDNNLSQERNEATSRLYDIYQAVYSVTATDNLDSVYASLGDFRLILRRQPRALPFKTVANVFGNPTFKSYAEWEYVCKIERNEVLIFFYEGLTGYVGDIDIIYSNDGRMKIGE